MAETVEIETREAKQDRRDNVASAGLDPRTWSRLEEWRKEQQITSRSDAARRLIRAGLDSKEADNIGSRTTAALATGVIMSLPLAVLQIGTVTHAIVLILLCMVYILTQRQVDNALASIWDRHDQETK